MESFDFRDTIVPFSLLQIANRFQRMEVGDAIEILGQEAGIERDLKSILPAAERAIHTIETIEAGRPQFRWRLTRIKRSTTDSKGGMSCLKSI
jgi:TusA-related sulfurtransferase